ncbi:MAG TPA: LytTR family DNA-binding domain-containing protein [Kofleriaceae bacterium]
MKALIVDDERLARARLRKLLDAHADVTVVAEADSVASARSAIAAHAPELIFLDITMPGGSGFDLLAHEPIAASVVFVTAYDEHAIRAFEVGAVDYLLKPIDPARLADSIRRASARSGPAPDRICVSSGASVRVVAIAEIILVNAFGDYTELVLRDGTTVTVKQPLTSWEERLGKAFVRVSRSALVSIADIETVERDEGSAYRLVLRGYASAVPVSRARGTAVKAALRKG